MDVLSETAVRVYSAEDKVWIPLPSLMQRGEGHVKVVHVDPARGTVIFLFRVSSDAELVPHTHRCHAIAYTLSGEWEYEGAKLRAGDVAYEPEDSTHAPSSGPGAEVLAILTSRSDQFLINHMPDGSELPLDLAGFQMLDGVSTEADLEQFLASTVE
jgi:quercetin dioxygenase-like cupin family protein